MTLLIVSHAFTAVLGKRKPEEDYIREAKSSKLATMSPSKLDDYSVYIDLQKDEKQKILDNCPAPDEDVPPSSLLYSGFGRFVDNLSGVADRSSNSNYKNHVDEIMGIMCRCGNEKDKQTAVLESLLKIIFRDPTTFSSIIEGYDATTDGHVLAAHGGPSVIVEFERSEPHLASHFLKLALGAKDEVSRGWRQPALGIIVRGEVRYLSWRTLLILALYQVQ